MKFIGREEECKAIDYLLKQKEYQGCVLYGRRRLGKTELLKHCLLDKGIPCVFFQCNQESEESNTQGLTNMIQETLAVSHLKFESFKEAMDYLFQYSRNHELYVVIDEYPYLRKLSSGIDSKLQELIDHYQHICKMKLFLSGSSVASMETILDGSNALHRRFQLALCLKEMDYFDSAKFYPTFSDEDKVRLFSVFGGIPYYNLQIDPSLSVEDNIILLATGRFAHLMDEITVNLKSELVKIGNAHAVFSAIAQGAFHYSDILTKSNIPTSASLNDILEKLQKMDMIRYVAPINDKRNKQKSGYRIADNLLRFYYQFVNGNLSMKELLDEHVFFERIIKPSFDAVYVPKEFEEIVRQFLIRKNRRGELNPLLYDLGTYWYDDPIEKKNGQFDVVGKTDAGYVFYEVKFRNTPMDETMIQQEVKQVTSCGLTSVQFGFVSKSGFCLTSDFPYQFYTLKDIYSL